MPSFISYFRGYVIITVSGNFTERFLNACAAQNILLWDITRLGSKTIRCKISVRAFRAIRKIAYRTGVTIKINQKRGLPFFLRQYKKRKLALFGVALFILVTIIMNQFVWDIEVRGNVTVKTADILSALEAEGLKCGIPKASIDQRTLKNKTMIRLPSLAWIWVDNQGSKVIVDVRERTPVPEIFQPNEYCNIVAKKDAVIDSFTIRHGVPTVKQGDTVREGMVLVTGKIPSPINPDIRYLQADANVYARTWYEKTGQFSRIVKNRYRTGKSKTQYTLKLFGKTLPLFHNSSNPYTEADREETKHELSVFGRYLGITLFSNTFHQVTVEEECFTEESVAKAGAKMLLEEIDEETLPDSQCMQTADSYTTIDDCTIEVTVKAEYKEDIAQKVRGENTQTP